MNCTDSELAEFVEKTISLRRYPARDDSENITDTGIVSSLTQVINPLATDVGKIFQPMSAKLPVIVFHEHGGLIGIKYTCLLLGFFQLFDMDANFGQLHMCLCLCGLI